MKIEPKRTGFGLKAPPKNTQHVLNNVRNLNKKIELQNKVDQVEEKLPTDLIDIGQNVPQEDLMDQLMQIDFTK